MIKKLQYERLLEIIWSDMNLEIVVICFVLVLFLLTFVWVFLDPAHEDYINLQSAYEAMLDVSEYINEVKRDSEQLQIINDIQASITDLPIAHGVALKDYGRLRKDAELKVNTFML